VSDEAQGEGQVTEASAAPPASNEQIPLPAWEAALANWINNHVRNSPIAGATESWNHLMGALPRLKEHLEEELRNPTVKET
jgi:hypothetical protein